MIRIIALILVLVMIAVPSLAEERAAEVRTARDIIKEMTVYYGTYGGEAEEKTAELLKELYAADQVLGAKWESIMRLWKTVNTDFEVHEGILPEGLPGTDELCLVVLGFQLNPDGSMRDELIERLKVAKACADQYPNALIVCTGGGTAAQNREATEAGEMAEWLIENGVDTQRVIVENQSKTTAQNAIYTWKILSEQYPQVKQLAIISSDYHIATGALLFGAEATLQAEAAGKEHMTVVSNAAWHAPSGTLSPMFQAGALLELYGDAETAFNIYYDTYDIHELPPLSGGAAAEDNGDDLLEIMLSTMTLREKAAQMMIASFRVWQEVPETEDGEKPAKESPKTKITELNDEIREMAARDHFGGILLFGENFTDPEQSLRLVSELQTANRDGGGIPQLIFVDQEGGNVNRIPYSTIGVSNMALGASGDPENARTMAAIHGEEIGLLGIQVDFAPVMDVNNNAANPVIGIRSFSDDPQTVAQYGCAYLAGLHDAGVIAALKHFPGHGNTDTDSHTGFPLINSTYEELKENELVPFKAAIDAGADMVMTAHIQYPQIERETYTSVSTGEQVGLPATMSRTILTDILRGDLGFDGLIVTDALDMAAITDNFSIEDTVKLTINAGVDLLILPAVKDTNLFKLTETYVDTAVALVESGEIDEARINESVRRILELKSKYGVLYRTDFTVTDEQVSAAKNGVGSAAHREAERKIAESALTLVKNDNHAFPLQVKPGEKTLILFADSCASRAGAGALVRQMLQEQQALPEGAEILVMKSSKGNEKACVREAVKADHVILVHRVYAQACLNPDTEDGFSSGTFDQVIEAVHEKGKPVIVVSCQLPYDAARFPDADAILLTYWGSAMADLPAKGSSWSANLPAGLLACFGLGEANGRLPVNIPALDASYQPADAILWPRGWAAGSERMENNGY